MKKTREKSSNISKFRKVCKEQGFMVAVIKGLLKLFKVKGYDLIRKDVLNQQVKPAPNTKRIDNKIDKTYLLPEILTEGIFPKRYEIVACAFRPQSAKGGPGAVLATMKDIFSAQSEGIRIKYFFKGDISIPANLEKATNNLPDIIKINFYAAYYIQRCVDIWVVCDDKTDVFFVCHDIGSAYGAYLSGKKYVLVYHNQGSIFNEATGAGLDIDYESEKIITKLEEIVMSHAQCVYFPSIGARNEYIDTCGFDVSGVNFGRPLYNTIPDAPINLDVEMVEEEFKLRRVRKNGYQIFLSVGDYNENKGIDRVPEFLKRYVELTHKKVYWIVAGNRQSTGIYEKFIEDELNWPFRAYIIGDRIPHDKILALMELSDFYIMLHRKSIFDLSTLEAMRAGLVPILTSVGGNPEFNCENNAVMVELEKMDEAIKKISTIDLPEMKERNIEVFNRYFSHEKFYESYSRMFKDEMEKLGIYPRFKSEINRINLSSLKDKYAGRTAVICGGGTSLQEYSGMDGAVNIALNRTLFYKYVKFDILFMQDYPAADSEHTMKDYNEYPCDKFYGCITNPLFKDMGFKKDEDFKSAANGQVYRYELAPRVYDASIDNFEFDLDTYCMADAQSVLFSALQFAVYAGFKKIYLAGIDWSDINYDNTQNNSTYARAVSNNLVVFKRKLRMYDDSIDINVINSANRIIRNNLGIYNKIITVSGIYTNSYKDVFKLQKESCLDNYRFDFRYVSDQEWQKAKTSADFAFFGGNTIKTQLVIDKIKQYWGELLLITDADIVFLKRTEDNLRAELADNDMVFMRERNSDEAYERTPLNINIGFVLMRCNEKSLNFWNEVQNRTKNNHGWDQEEANIILEEKAVDLKWAMLSDVFLNGGDVNAQNIRRQLICSACGTVAKRYKLKKLQYLKQILNMANKKVSRWFDGTPIQE